MMVIMMMMDDNEDESNEFHIKKIATLLYKFEIRVVLQMNDDG